MQIKIKIEGEIATCWVGDDESDSFVIHGPPATLEAMARVVRASTVVEHEFSQRGASREPVVNDMTKAEIEAAAAAKVEAEKQAAQAAEAAKLEANRAALKAERDRLSALLGE